MVSLDKIDVKILAALQDNGKITNVALAERISLSASACLARVQRLREAGVIERDVAVLAASKIGPALHAVLEVTLKNHNVNDHRAFERGISTIPEVTMAIKVSGRIDYLLSITTVDMQTLNSLSDQLLDGALGIEKLMTLPVLEIAKPFSGLPVSTLYGGK